MDVYSSTTSDSDFILPVKEGLPVVVIGTADFCGHCTTFKNNHRNGVRNEFSIGKLMGKYNLVEINIPIFEDDDNREKMKDFSRGLSEEHHPDLMRFISWFPTVLMFSWESWNNKSGKLAGHIMNGKILADGKVDMVENATDAPTKNGISNWVLSKSGQPFPILEKEDALVDEPVAPPVAVEKKRSSLPKPKTILERVSPNRSRREPVIGSARINGGNIRFVHSPIDE